MMLFTLISWEKWIEMDAKCNGCSGDKHSDLHPHFQCLDCGNMDCLDVNVTLPKVPNRKIEVSQMLIQGKCETCIL